jgi:signal recognition particle protein
MAASAVNVAAGDIAEVEALKGIRVSEEDDGRPRVEYLVQWKDGSPNTWEPASNLADNLLRDYENRWWTAVKKADLDTIYDMLAIGGPVLARTVDDNRRTALHFAAALNKAELVQRLLTAGAEVDLADKDGYTPLHMAAGYLHTATITELLANGADPEQKDRMGRSPLELVESFHEGMPADNPAFVPRRMAVEDVLKVLTDNLFEDVEPVAVLESRIPEDEEGNKLSHREFLIKFPGEEEPLWTHEKYVSAEVIEDYESGLEYAEAESIVDVRNRGDSRTYLVRWGDGYPDSWEDEENVSLDLIKIFEESKK